jgi:hypothetical protein
VWRIISVTAIPNVLLYLRTWRGHSAYPCELGISRSIDRGKRRDFWRYGCVHRSVSAAEESILTLVPIFIFFFTVRLPAVLFLGYWFVIQFLSGFSTLGEVDQTGVARWAHIGGFLLGAFMAWGI